MESQLTGVLVSGGLDSSILLGELLRQGQPVQPLYVRFQLIWEPAELAMLRQFLQRLACPQLRPLVVLDLPLTDLYGSHWSIDGQQTPGANSPDEAVYLPGRNALLLLKAGLWCQLHGVSRIALGPLSTNPFADARADFFRRVEDLLETYAARLEILAPFLGLKKPAVMRMGRGLPLEWTFSCLAPVDSSHCGRCNKCAERRQAFREVETSDPTCYIDT